MTGEPQQKALDSNPLLTELSARLPDFSIGTPEGLDFSDLSQGKLDREDFPVPELVLFVLRNVLRWKWSGKEEKVRWSVYGAVAGEPVIFEFAKFGLRLYRPQSSVCSIPLKRIIGPLKSGIDIAEKYLQPHIDSQIQQGEVIIANYFSEFVGRYQYFRKKADLAYRRAAKEPRPRKPAADDEPPSIMRDLVHAFSHRREADTEGFYNSVSMVDCYFSSLEHRLMLLRAFTGKPMASGGLQGFLKLTWESRLAEVLGPVQPASTGRLIKKLKDIKARIRNPFAHGGYENDKGALHVYLPFLGSTIPGNFTRFGKSVRFSMVPVEANDHAESCRVFDELDELLQSNELAAPHALMREGIDPSFDAESLQHYFSAVTEGDEALRSFIEYWSHIYEREANMDY